MMRSSCYLMLLLLTLILQTPCLKKSLPMHKGFKFVRDPTSDPDFPFVDTSIKAKREELKGADLLGVLVNDNYVGCRVFEVQYIIQKSGDISVIMARLNLSGRIIDIINNLDGMTLKPTNTVNILTKTYATSSSSSNIQSDNHASLEVATSVKLPSPISCEQTQPTQPQTIIKSANQGTSKVTSYTPTPTTIKPIDVSKLIIQVCGSSSTSQSVSPSKSVYPKQPIQYIQPTTTLATHTVIQSVQPQSTQAKPPTSQTQIINQVLPIEQSAISPTQLATAVPQPQVTSSLASSQQYSNNPYFIYCDNLVRTQHPYELTNAQVVDGQVKPMDNNEVNFIITYSSGMGRYEASVIIKDNQGSIDHFNALPGNPPLDKLCKTWLNGVCKQCVYRAYFGSDSKCVEIDNQCNAFDQVTGKCTSCYLGYTLSEGKCIVTASSPSPPPNCQKIDSLGKCLVCDYRYYLDTNSLCVKISDQCQTWNDHGECLTCYQGYALFKGQCLLPAS